MNALKGESTRQIVNEGLHPLHHFSLSGRRPPRMWSTGEFKVFLDSEVAIENAIAYVEKNPVEEGRPVQHWNFVRPFAGLENGWTTYHDDLEKDRRSAFPPAPPATG